MLSNAYFLAKFRFDTAENEPAKNLQNFRKMHFRKMHFRKMRTLVVRDLDAGDRLGLHALARRRAAALVPDTRGEVLLPLPDLGLHFLIFDKVELQFKTECSSANRKIQQTSAN